MHVFDPAMLSGRPTAYTFTVAELLVAPPPPQGLLLCSDSHHFIAVSVDGLRLAV